MNQIINGLSDTPINPTEPIGALNEFYRAFNRSEMPLMAENWFHTPSASMSNPLGGIKRGWQEIETVYQNIFFGPAKVYVEYYDFTIEQSEQMFCAVGRERGFFELDGQKIELAIRTSRIYQWQNNRWRQLHHHGSIENPALLQSYQQQVLGKPKQAKWL